MAAPYAHTLLPTSDPDLDLEKASSDEALPPYGQPETRPCQARAAIANNICKILLAVFPALCLFYLLVCPPAPAPSLLAPSAKAFAQAIISVIIVLYLCSPALELRAGTPVAEHATQYALLWVRLVLPAVAIFLDPTEADTERIMWVFAVVEIVCASVSNAISSPKLPAAASTDVEAASPSTPQSQPRPGAVAIISCSVFLGFLYYMLFSLVRDIHASGGVPVHGDPATVDGAVSSAVIEGLKSVSTAAVTAIVPMPS
ncbi:hypothetical protein MIND_01311800 [Mycena indigotica]|uniref:Uncharacterized protein n=1 Tax=Mycena indigotica TaxID=2126181 RepID=A0A8H6S287_9AGAR|nr:uncharacterized protein MIND_01311800 [Mycena indigotica]KAF7290711.1 hypothetical protein MIND_01311800 [Mycena indigotica]